MGSFSSNAKAMGLGYAFDCLFADIQYKCDVKSFEAESERIKKRLERREKLKKEMEEEEAEDLFDDDVEEDTEVEKTASKTHTTKKETKKKQEEEQEEDSEDNELLALPASVGAFSDSDIEENLKSAYKILSDIDQKKVKFTILSLLYTGCLINSNQLYKYLDKTEVSDIEFINAVLNEIADMPLNPAYAAPKLDTLIDRQAFERIFDFESLYKELENNWAFQEISKTLYKEIKDDDKSKAPIIPVQFDITPTTNMEATPKITKSEIDKLNAEFGDLLNGYQYQFNKIYDNYELVLSRPMGPDVYTIDPGNVFGIGTSLVFAVYGSIVPVSLEHKDIIKKLLEDKNNLLTLSEDEKSRMFAKLLPDFRIYQCIDMSRGKEIFDKISPEAAQQFIATLSKILNMPWGSEQLPMLPRLRVKRFANANNFDLVSDDKVKIVYMDGFNSYITPMSITVYRNKVTIKSKDLNLEVDMDK